jgi:hypothetical protein
VLGGGGGGDVDRCGASAGAEFPAKGTRLINMPNSRQRLSTGANSSLKFTCAGVVGNSPSISIMPA